MPRHGTCVGLTPRAHATIARSSGAVEPYSIGLGVAETIFLRSLLTEAKLLPHVTISVFIWSPTGKSTATRHGASRKTRHIELHVLGARCSISQGLLNAQKVKDLARVAYLGTKYSAKEKVSCLRDLVGAQRALPRRGLRRQVGVWRTTTTFVTTTSHDAASFPTDR